MKKQKFPASSKPGIKRSPPKVGANSKDDSDDPSQYDDDGNDDDTGDDGESEDNEDQEDGDHEGDEEPSEEQTEVKEDQMIGIMHQVLQKVDALGQMLGGGAPAMPGMGAPQGMPSGGPGMAPPQGTGASSPEVEALVRRAMGQ